MTCSGHLCPPSPWLGLMFFPGIWVSLGEATVDGPRLSGLIWRLIKAKPCCFLLLLTSACIGNSLYSKTACLLDGSEQLVVKFVIVLVGRNVDPIKTGKTEENILKLILKKQWPSE